MTLPPSGAHYPGAAGFQQILAPICSVCHAVYLRKSCRFAIIRFLTDVSVSRFITQRAKPVGFLPRLQLTVQSDCQRGSEAAVSATTLGHSLIHGGFDMRRVVFNQKGGVGKSS